MIENVVLEDSSYLNEYFDVQDFLDELDNNSSLDNLIVGVINDIS